MVEGALQMIINADKGGAAEYTAIAADGGFVLQDTKSNLFVSFDGTSHCYYSRYDVQEKAVVFRATDVDGGVKLQNANFDSSAYFSYEGETFKCRHGYDTDGAYTAYGAEQAAVMS